MADSVVIEVPPEFPAGEGVTAVKNPHAGRVTVPAKWTGGDWQAYYEASLAIDQDNKDRQDHQWLRQWRWAKERVKEWELEGLSTNPKEIDDGKLPWPLMSFLTKAVHGTMLDYLDKADSVIETLNYPSWPELEADEFFAAEKIGRELRGKDEFAPLIRAWRTGRVLVRQWANGSEPSEGGLDVDLALIGAVNEIVGEVFIPAMNLGNSRGPRGRP